MLYVKKYCLTVFYYNNRPKMHCVDFKSNSRNKMKLKSFILSWLMHKFIFFYCIHFSCFDNPMINFNKFELGGKINK